MIRLFAFLAALCAPVHASYVIPDGAVKTSKLANQSVTQVKLGTRPVGTAVTAGGVASSSSSGVFSTTSTSAVDVTGMSVTITTTGRPVMILSQGVGGQQGIFSLGGTATTSGGFFNFARCTGNCPTGLTTVSSTYLAIQTGVSTITNTLFVPCSMSYVDTPAAGTYIYKMQIYGFSASNTEQVNNCQIVAYEL